MIKLTLANSLFISGFMNSSINYINTNWILLSQLSPIIPLITERYQVDNNKSLPLQASIGRYDITMFYLLFPWHIRVLNKSIFSKYTNH